MNTHHIAILRAVLLTEDGNSVVDDLHDFQKQHEMLFRRGFTDEHFSCLQKHLSETLSTVGVPNDVIDQAESVILSFYSALCGGLDMTLAGQRKRHILVY